MKIVTSSLVFTLLWSVSVSLAGATAPETYTNDNFFTSEQESPRSFWRDNNGCFRGVTVSGRSFVQRPIVTDISVRLHSFSIDQASFYISTHGIILADSDTTALSIYLARVGWEEVV